MWQMRNGTSDRCTDLLEAGPPHVLLVLLCYRGFRDLLEEGTVIGW